jgi:hypothetical protein
VAGILAGLSRGRCPRSPMERPIVARTHWSRVNITVHIPTFQDLPRHHQPDRRQATRQRAMNMPPTSTHDDSARPPHEPTPAPRALMLGMGWFPTSLGGLNRYYRSLFEALGGAGGVVVGPAEDAPSAIDVVGGARTGLARRMLGFWLAAGRAATRADVIDAHFALYAAAPLLLGRARRLPAIFHFQGPWAQENIAAGDSSRLKYALRAALERLVLRRVDATWSCPRRFAGCSWSATACARGTCTCGRRAWRSTPSPPATPRSRERALASRRAPSSRSARAVSCRAWGSTICSTRGASSSTRCRRARCCCSSATARCASRSPRAPPPRRSRAGCACSVVSPMRI